MLNTDELKKLGVDTDEGLMYCADDPEFYEEMLAEFLAEGRERAEGLRRFFKDADWKSCGIAAHSVKSTSRMIGASALSELSRELELAAKSGDGEAVAAAHPAFISKYEELLSGLEKLL